MKALILAAGSGTRLNKYTENLPKGMLDFMGKTIIARQIELYRKVGIKDIIIVRGFAKDKIDYEGVTYYDNEEYATTNMLHSLLEAREQFDTDFIVSYSDVLFEEQMLLDMMNNKNDFVCAVDMEWKKYWQKRYDKIDFDTESLTLDDNGNITSLGKENPPIEEIDARYIGLLKFSKKGLAKIVQVLDDAYINYLDKSWQQSGHPIKKAYMTDLLQALIEDGQEVKAHKFNNGWVEFDTNEDYERTVSWAEDGSLKDVLFDF